MFFSSFFFGRGGGVRGCGVPAGSTAGLGPVGLRIQVSSSGFGVCVRTFSGG